MIARMYAAAKEVVIFNLLNKDVFLKPTLLKAYDKNDVLSFCHTLTPKVRVIDDYSTSDFTIVLGEKLDSLSLTTILLLVEKLLRFIDGFI